MTALTEPHSTMVALTVQHAAIMETLQSTATIALTKRHAAVSGLAVHHAALKQAEAKSLREYLLRPVLPEEAGILHPRLITYSIKTYCQYCTVQHNLCMQDTKF